MVLKFTKYLEKNIIMKQIYWKSHFLLVWSYCVNFSWHILKVHLYIIFCFYAALLFSSLIVFSLIQVFSFLEDMCASEKGKIRIILINGAFFIGRYKTVSQFLYFFNPAKINKLN
jgi:hypothetical protein